MTPENLQKILEARARNDTAATLKILEQDAKERLATEKQEDKKKAVLKAFGVIEPRPNRYNSNPSILRYSSRYPGVQEVRYQGACVI